MTDLLQDDRNGAVISDDGTYRYRLWRTWDVSLPAVAFVMLNPSTADDVEDDPTIRRCRGYAERWGYGRLEVVNLFALRATDPSDLREHADPVGPENDRHIREVCLGGPMVVAAWGIHGELQQRGREVATMLDERGVPLYAIGTTQAGHPWHPSRKPADADPSRFGYGGVRG